MSPARLALCGRIRRGAVRSALLIPGHGTAFQLLVQDEGDEAFSVLVKKPERLDVLVFFRGKAPRPGRVVKIIQCAVQRAGDRFDCFQLGVARGPCDDFVESAFGNSGLCHQFVNGHFGFFASHRNHLP